MKSNLSVFANVFIDTEERYLRMIDSFESFKKVNIDNYVINVRGRFAKKVQEYLIDKDKNLICTNLESGNGWLYDSRQISKNINSEYILIWIEDHLCLKPEKLNTIINEMISSKSDILTYSYWNDGDMLKRYKNVDKVELNDIFYFDHTRENNHLVQKERLSYIISLVSIIKRDLFEKILQSNSEKRWDKHLPFDFEKAPNDTHWLPIRRAICKYELFASIDDDLESIGGSLQSRGLYPIRENRVSYAHKKGNFFNRLKNKIRRLIYHYND